MSSNFLYVGYCFVCVLIYLSFAFEHHLRHKPLNYHTAVDIAIAICFVIYLSGHKAMAVTVGLTAVAVQIILDAHFNKPENRKKLEAKRAEIVKQRSQKNDIKSHRQKLVGRDDVNHD